MAEHLPSVLQVLGSTHRLSSPRKRNLKKNSERVIHKPLNSADVVLGFKKRNLSNL